VLGVLNGLIVGLLAVGLVLVYRSNRFINLAHAQLGAVPALILAKFVLDWGWGWWPAALVCVAVGVLTGVLVDRGIISRVRAKAASAVPLLLLTVGVSQLLLALTYIPALSPNQDRLDARGYPVPFETHVRIGGVVLGGQYVLILILVPVLVAALALFLRYSIVGKMIRGAASNPDVARLCGISTARMSTVTWAIAGALAAITAILEAPSEGSFNAATLGPDLLLLSLGAAAFGGFVSISGALAGGVLIGVAEQLTLAQTNNGGTAELVVLMVIVAIVLVRGRTIAGAFSSAAPIEDRPRTRVPAAVRERAVVRHQPRWLAGAAAVLAVLLPLAPFFRAEAHRFELSLVVVFALVGVAITMVVGWAGQVSLGHFALVGAGAFVTGRLAAHGWSLPLLMLAAGLVGAVVMIVVGLPALRVRGLTLAVTTLGLAVVAPDWLFRQSWFGAPGSFGLEVKPLGLARGLGHPASQLSMYYLALVTLAVVMVLARALRNSEPGRLVIAVRDNERAASTFGITPATVKLGILAFSGSVAAVAGVLWADAWRGVSLDQFPPDLSLAILAVPVIGGLGSVGGAVAGAAALYVPTYFVSPYLSGLFGNFGHQIGFQLALGGLGLVGVLLAYPTGIAGAAQRAWEVFLARLAAATAASDRASDMAAALEVGEVRLRFGGVQALEGASIEVRRGEIVGLIGPNGAGKTTLMNVISGIVQPDSGSVRIEGTEMVGLSAEFRSSFGLARSFQDAALFPGLTVAETVQLALASKNRVGFISAAVRAPWVRRTEALTRAEAGAVLTRLGLDGYRDALTSELSTGTRRICDLAAQVASGPKLLLLDEPTAGVAQREAEAFGPLVRRIRDELDCAILIVEHDMPLLMSLCDRVYAMESGAVIAEGTPDEVRSDAKVIASYLGTDEAAIHRSGRAGGPRRNGKAAATRRTTAPRAPAKRAAVGRPT
jgi:ABC-type branched-subunit amino acid transport system ATPase component/ABC-type branched-subunit amino acid transport system permease subunit